MVNRLTPFEALPELLTVVEYRAWTGLGKNSAYEQLRSGAVRSVKMGRLIRIPKAALRKYVAV